MGPARYVRLYELLIFVRYKNIIYSNTLSFYYEKIMIAEKLLNEYFIICPINQLQLGIAIRLHFQFGRIQPDFLQSGRVRMDLSGWI